MKLYPNEVELTEAQAKKLCQISKCEWPIVTADSGLKWDGSGWSGDNGAVMSLPQGVFWKIDAGLSVTEMSAIEKAG